MTTSEIKINRIMFVIDRSHSMSTLLPYAIDSFNQNVESIRNACKETGQAATVSLITFSDDVEVKFVDRPIEYCKHVDRHSINHAGMTALFDATATAIASLENIHVANDEDVTYLVIVITDGEENNSRISAKNLIDKIKRIQGTDLWTLSFLVPPGYSKQLSRIGIPSGNIMEWTQTVDGVKNYGVANSSAIGSYFKNRAQGKTNTTSFYADLSDVKREDVKNVLRDVTNDVAVLSVKKDSQVRPFIEEQGLEFKKGNAFYQLLERKEGHKVQKYKEVMIREKYSKNKKKKKIYSGSAARQLLGLPDHEVKVRPGDHGDWDIFIQSTSVNRKLPKGSTLLYKVS